MIALTSTAAPVRYGFPQASAPQLRAAAERAQRDADFLQLQAREAWQKVATAETNARVADGLASDAVVSAARAQGDLVAFESRSQAASSSGSPDLSLSPVEARPTIPSVSPVALSAAQPSFNNMGQRIGSLINVTV